MKRRKGLSSSTASLSLQVEALEELASYYACVISSYNKLIGGDEIVNVARGILGPCGTCALPVTCDTANDFDSSSYECTICGPIHWCGRTACCPPSFSDHGGEAYCDACIKKVD